MVLTRVSLGIASLALTGVIGCTVAPESHAPPNTGTETAENPAPNSTSASPTAPPALTWPADISWQYHLDGQIPDDPQANVVILDVDVSAEEVAALNDRGIVSVCYFSLGTVEDWRDDAGLFPPEVVGKALSDWPDERYLDLRALDELAPIWATRLDVCAAKGFAAVDPDNIDAFTNDSGFPLTETDTIAALEWLSAEAHDRGLAVGLKNAPELVERATLLVDFAVVEQCVRDEFCGAYTSLVSAGKPVLAVEYREDGATLENSCSAEKAYGVSMLVANLDLASNGEHCPPSS